MIDVVCAGDVLLKITPEDAGGVPADGCGCSLGGLDFEIAGSSAITGIILNRLGIFTPIMGRISDDVVGRGIIPIVFREYGGAWQHLHMVRGVKSSYIFDTGSSETGCLSSTAAQAEFSSDDIDFSIIGKSRILHLTVSGMTAKLVEDDARELRFIIKRARELGAAVSLNISGGLPLDVFEESIAEMTDIVIAGSYYAGAEDAVETAAAAGRFISRGVKAAAIVVEGKGVFIKTSGKAQFRHPHNMLGIDMGAWAGRELFSPFYKASVKCAGVTDCVSAGLLAGIVTGSAMERAVDMACAVDAFCEAEGGSVSGVVSLEKLAERINNGWEKEKADKGYACFVK